MNSEFKPYKYYKEIEIVDARPYIPGEDLSNVEYLINPEEGDMIVHNLKGQNDFCVVEKEFFEKFFVPMKENEFGHVEEIDEVELPPEYYKGPRAYAEEIRKSIGPRPPHKRDRIGPKSNKDKFWFEKPFDKIDEDK
ncbi:MAG: hypothetical protein ACOCQD_00800 [archaeon]